MDGWIQLETGHYSHLTCHGIEGYRMLLVMIKVAVIFACAKKVVMLTLTWTV